MMSQMMYQDRQICIEYDIDCSTMHIECITFKGRDITGLIDHEKVYDDLPEAIYEQGIINQENQIQL